MAACPAWVPITLLINTQEEWYLLCPKQLLQLQLAISRGDRARQDRVHILNEHML